MTHTLRLLRRAPTRWPDLAHVIGGVAPRRAAADEPPQLYRSEAFCEDLEDGYAMPASRLQPRRAALRTLLALAWTASLLLATVVAIHGSLA